MPVELRGAEARRGDVAVVVQINLQISIEFRLVRLRREQHIAPVADRLELVRRARPRHARAADDADLRRPLVHHAQIMPRGETVTHLIVDACQTLRVTQNDTFFLPSFERENAARPSKVRTYALCPALRPFIICERALVSGIWPFGVI